MRPCNNCGEPVENHRLYCEACERPPSTAEELDTSPSEHPAKTYTPKHLFLVAAELVVRTLLLGCFVTIALGALLMLFMPIAGSLIVASSVGLVVGLGWTMMEMYFQSGPH